MIRSIQPVLKENLQYMCDQMEELTKGEKLISKINMVFDLLRARRDDTAAAVLQQVFDELKEIK